MPLKDAGLPLNDLGILRAYGVFDFLKTVNGRPFLWSEHWRRFQNSAKFLGLVVPALESQTLTAVKKLMQKNRRRDAGIRLLLTGGPTPDGLTIVRPSFGVLIEELHNYPPKVFKQGAKLITTEFQRPAPQAKTTNYLNVVRLQKYKKRRGAIEILYVSQGKVLECSTSNFFIVKNNVLITPKDDILIGTVRNLVIKLAKQQGIKVEERDASVSELKTADEAFLTATSKDIIPIVRIDNFKINSGKVGEITKKLMQVYNDFVANY